jgi:hypothetical protein
MNPGKGGERPVNNRLKNGKAYLPCFEKYLQAAFGFPRR